LYIARERGTGDELWAWKNGRCPNGAIRDGKIKTSNLIGYFRKLSETSEKIFEEIIKNINE
jgi:hypothetical protein